MTDQPAERIVICGAGISGLTTAISLARRGIACKLVETRSEKPIEGAGIQLGPNATRLLDGLGLTGAISQHATRPSAIQVYAGSGGGLLATLPLGPWLSARHDAPYWVLHRADLIAELWNEAEREPLIDFGRGTTLDRVPIDQRHDRIDLCVASDETMQADLLIGADGIWSDLRRFVDPNADLEFTGLHAARTIIPRDALPARIDGSTTGVWLAPSVHLVHYPIKNGDKLAVIAIAKGPTPQSGAAEWSRAVEPATVLERFAATHVDVRSIIMAGTEWRQWPLYRPRNKWRWRRGRAVLIGDAAHPILPFLAQGGAMAIEDGVVLASEIADRLNGRATKPRLDAASAADLLESFVEKRRARVERVQAASAANGRAYHLSGAASLARNAGLATLSGQGVMARYDWIYGANVMV